MAEDASEIPTLTLRIPRWAMRLIGLGLLGAFAWAGDVSMQLRAQRTETATILKDHERRITRLEQKNDELTTLLLQGTK